MIVLECDNCERSFDVDPAQAGGKVPCPHCGDVNRVPADEPAEKPPEKPAEKPPDEPAREPAPPRPATEPIKSYEGRPLPPDGGPEQDICMVHPAMARAHPFRFLIIGILLIGGAGVAIWGATTDNSWGWLKWPALVSLAAGAIWWIGWYVGAHLWVKLEISNKRTIRKEGIIRRHTSEVLHDHVRNVEIRQSFVQRLLNVGYLGISSSGQDGIEIEVRDLPRPYELKSLIDNYRDM
ncbi:MAG: PH domain-containing protein [Planctomycetota bacterium]